MKKTVLFLAVLTLVIYFSSCRKCYTCHNNCMICFKADSVFVNNVYADSIHIDTAWICSDSYNTTIDYLAAISADTAAHFKCININPTYSHHFCAYPNGQSTYLNDFDEGGRAQCDLK